MERADPATTYFIDILFFYTDGFADDFVRRGDSMSHEIWQSVSMLNAALANSKVNATARIVGVEQLPGMPDDQDVALQMIRQDERATARRNVLGADLVYALVDDRAGYLGVACQPYSGGIVQRWRLLLWFGEQLLRRRGIRVRQRMENGASP